MKVSYTLEPGQYLTYAYAHSHITRAVAAVDSCFGLNLLGLISMTHPSGRKYYRTKRPTYSALYF